MKKEENIKNLLTELVEMIDNGSQRDLDRADEISNIILKALEKQEQKTEWIPVSERLPEDNTKVIVSRGDTYEEEVITTWYQDKEHGFLCGQVIAWQPKPKPYKEG